MPETGLLFHSETTGWVPAEPMTAADAEFPQEQRDGTAQLKALLPGGRIVFRQNVAHQSHHCLINILNGRCRLCGRAQGELAFGRVYRAEKDPSDARPRETEPAVPLRDPETLQEARGQRTRTRYA